LQEEDVDAVEPESGLLKIGEVAERVGLSLRTVRYYEEIGLFTPSGRSPGGFRLYAERDVARLAILKGMKPFGLPLEDIRDLMELLDRSGTAVPLDDTERARLHGALAAYRDRAGARLRQLDAHADEVRRLRDTIDARLAGLEASNPES
jgi:DNA-binding transcriptional MerR regulator